MLKRHLEARLHSDTLFLPLAVTNNDRVVSEVDVLYAQAHAFREPQP
jgi:hypothetical protein